MINVVNIFEANVGPITRAARLSPRLVTAAALQHCRRRGAQITRVEELCTAEYL